MPLAFVFQEPLGTVSQSRIGGAGAVSPQKPLDCVPTAVIGGPGGVLTVAFVRCLRSFPPTVVASRLTTQLQQQ